MRAMDIGSRQVNWSFDPLEAVGRWPASQQVLLLHSGRYDAQWASRSILAEPVGTYQFVAAGGGQSRWIGPTLSQPVSRWTHRPFTDLRQILDATAGCGIWIGYLSYDLGRWIERLPSGAANDRDWPIIELGYCPGYLVHDTGGGRWSAHGRWRDGGYPDLDARSAATGAYGATEPRSVLTRDQYERSVRRILEYIAAGDVFQVNFAQRFTADLQADWPAGSRAMFDQLARTSPAWYGAYLESALDERSTGKRRAIASTSPELFLQVDPPGHVVTRPIKGTLPASMPAEILQRSEKDTAELHMIVDLLRNDLGRVCDYGSVRVEQARTIETHPTIHHGVATIRGRLHDSQDVVDLLRACLPGGSVTGAPKIRAMQIIDELEPVRRGPYCGAIGCISKDAMAVNIAIRTMLIELEQAAPTSVAHAGQRDSGRVDFSVGGGIVADSDPSAEYEETLAKAAAIVRTLGGGREARSMNRRSSIAR